MPYLSKFKERKAELGIKNAEIAALSNIPLSTVNRFFSEEHSNPSFANIAGIAVVLGISLDELIGMKEPNEAHINSRVESTIISYAELLKDKETMIAEKDLRIQEKDDTIARMTSDKKSHIKERQMLLTVIGILAAIVAFFLLFDLANGHIGYIRY